MNHHFQEEEEEELCFEGFNEESQEHKIKEPIFATKYEICAVISSRAKQLASSGVRKDFLPPQVPLDYLNDPTPNDLQRPRFDPIRTAIEELKAGKLDMEIRRRLRTGEHQIINVKNMVIPLGMLPEEW